MLESKFIERSVLNLGSSLFEAATPINESDLPSLRREVLTLILLASTLEEASLHRRMTKIKTIETAREKKNLRNLTRRHGRDYFLAKLTRTKQE